MNEELLNSLFKILIGFISINCAVNWLLYRTNKTKAYSVLCYYWISVGLVFPIQDYFRSHDNLASLGFMISIIPVTIITRFMDKMSHTDYPSREYMFLYMSCLLASIGLQSLGLSFQFYCLPVALAPAIPLLRTAKVIFIDRRKAVSALTRLMGFLSVITAIHGFNFLVFRPFPEMQFWGWSVSFVLYQSWSILLPVFAHEHMTVGEKERLADLVRKRTADLSEALDELNKNSIQTRSLLRVLVHDIANPLHTQFYCLEQLQAAALAPQEKRYIEQMKRAAMMVKEITEDVRELECVSSGKKQLDLEAVDFEECIEEIQFLFSKQLVEKRIKLKLRNELPAGVCLHVNKQSFVHSVLANLLSNSLKFSPHGSTIELVACELNGKVQIQVKDEGIGIEASQLKDLFNPLAPTSRLGVYGESGTGFGLPIVKSYLERYAGKIEINSFPRASLDMLKNGPQCNGTKVILTLNKA